MRNSVAQSTRTDEELAQRVAQGSAEALRELVERWYGQVHAYCRRRVRPPLDADDVCQEVFVKVVRQLRTAAPKGPWAPWLFAVARSVVTDAIRRVRREAVMHDGFELRFATGVGASRADPVDRLSDGELENDLWTTARQVLSPRALEALTLRVYHGLEVRAIAAAMGLTTTHVKVLLFRARRALLRAGVAERLRVSLQEREVLPYPLTSEPEDPR